jgi:outer membrane protein assembly factor BamA
MLFRTRAFATVALASAAVCLVPAAGAQNPKDDADQTERPEVRAVEFHGVRSVPLGDLRQSIATKASSCLSLLFRPICLFTKSPYFYERRYLDPLEFRRDVLRVLVFYYKRGWRDARVDTTVTRTGDEIRVRFDVVEGPPTLVDTVVVAGLRGILRPPGRRRSDRRLIRPGEPLNLLRLDSAVLRIRTALLDRGYGNAAVDAPRVDEDTAAHRARVTIETRPGTLTPIARVDVVRLSGKADVSDETIRNSLRFEPGDLFRRGRIAESQRALYESGLFRSALIDTAVAPDAVTGRTVCSQQTSVSEATAAAAGAVAAARQPADTTKNVVVCVLEGTLHDARVGVGFTTADFFAVQGNYTDNYFLGGPRRLQVTAQVGNLGAQQLNGRKPFFDLFSNIPANQQDARYFAPTFQLGADVRQRWFLSPRNTFGGGVFAHRRSSPGVFVDRGYGSNVAFTRNLTPQLPVSATYRFEINRVEAGDVYFCVNFGTCDFQTIGALQGQQRLSPAALSGSVSTADDPLEPQRGWIGRAEYEHASRVTLSDYRFNRAFVSGATYLRLPVRRAVLALRGQAGWVRALESTNAAVGVSGGEPVLHPSRRFYAGGSQSVRGYGENQLGPRVLTIDPNRLRGRSVASGDTSFACASSAAALSACFAQRGDSLDDTDFVERPLGGTTLLLGSAEVRVPIWGPVLGAVFVDAAVLGERSLGDFANSTAAITPGFGVRYLSPVGPVRLDIGFRPKNPEALPVLTQLTDSTGGRLLVDLTGGKGCSGRSGAAEGCRRFPLREADGAVRRFLDRLTLHLSIGEAF